MNIITGAEDLAPHSRRDYGIGGLDANEGRPVISSDEALDLLVEGHKDRAQGRMTVIEWRSYQRDLISRTVPGKARDLMVEKINALTIKSQEKVEV